MQTYNQELLVRHQCSLIPGMFSPMGHSQLSRVESMATTQLHARHRAAGLFVPYAQDTGRTNAGRVNSITSSRERASARLKMNGLVSLA